MTPKCSQGLHGVPATLAGVRGECGLLSPEWDGYGSEWQEFTWKWLAAEAILVKSGKGTMTQKDIQSSGLPQPLQQWALSHITKKSFDPVILNEQFGELMSKWWRGIARSGLQEGDDVLKHLWCRTGHTGIIMLVLGMKWWAEHSGGGKKWQTVLKEMTAMFQAVSNAPSL